MIKDQELMALVIWWCEGTKPRKDKRWKNAYLCPIEVTNTDYRIIKIFTKYLTNVLRYPSNKIHVQLQIHEDNNKNKVEKYWQNRIGIPEAQFDKTIIRKVGNKPGKSLGTCKIRIYDKNLFKLLNKKLKHIQNGA